MTNVDKAPPLGTSTKGYLLALAAGAIFWIIVRQAIHAHLLPRFDSTLFFLLVAFTWNAASWRRIGVAYVYHVAPYVTLAGLYGASWGAAVGQAQYAPNPVPPTLFDIVALWVGLPLIPVWLIVTIVLCARRPK